MANIEFSSIKGFLEAYSLEPWHWGDERLNKLRLPRLSLKTDDDGALAFNHLVEICENDDRYHKGILRTISGGIRLQTGLGYDIDESRGGLEFIFLDYVDDELIGFRVTIGSASSITNKASVTGRGSYFRMIQEFKKDGIDLKSYAITNGKDVKKQIKKPMIDLTAACFEDITYEHAYHIDFHSAYPSGMCAAYPELKPTCERIYNNRKKSEKDKELKLQMDAAIGFFQSGYCSIDGYGFALANLAKAGVNWCRKSVLALERELWDKGKMVLAFNTDGIWYVDEQGDFSSDWIGEGLGKAGIDHKDCTIRFKSKGAYEYMEDGKYHPVVRGATILDRLKSRDEWEWGDIYDAPIIAFRWDKKARRLRRAETK